MRTAASSLAPLFRSDGQARLLADLFLSAEQEFNINDLSERTGLAYASVHREVGKLLGAGVLAERRVGQARMIRPNTESVLYGPLRELLLVAFGPVPLLRSAFEHIAGVVSVTLFGSYAARLVGEPGPPPQDVDVLVVGSPDAMAVYDACERVAREVGRPVNPTILTVEEWRVGSGFADHVRGERTVPVLGDLPAPAVA
jgi:DNA-binding transcriptional ArsR family regulator